MTAVVILRPRHRAQLTDAVDAGVQDVALLEGGAQRAVEPVLEVEVVSPLDDVGEEVTEEGRVLVEQGRQLEGVLGGDELVEPHRTRAAARPSPGVPARGRGTAALRPRA